MSDLPAPAIDALDWLRQIAPTVFADRRDLHIDSRRINDGDVFIALRGEQVDGRDYLASAAQRGAIAALVEADGWQHDASLAATLPTRAVGNLRSVLGPLAADFYRHPSGHLLTIGVTGTNGKTSSTQWIAQVLTRTGRRCAVIGTLGAGLVDQPLVDGVLTTPDPVSLQREVRALLDAGARALAMEVSSIGLEQGRLNGMKFDVALFTNLTRDHLDYHGTMQQYEAAKALLFEWPTLSHAVVNLDDEAGRRLIPRLSARGVEVIGYSTKSASDALVAQLLTASDIRATAHGLAFKATLDRRTIAVEVPIIGQFNVENLLGVLGVTHACGIEFDRAVAALSQLAPPAGRMQQIAQAGQPDAPLAVIDYAHTPDALAKAIDALRPLVNARGGKLWVVFGAGGDRDAGKRAPMGAVAAHGADAVVITSDNPRSEDPQRIISQVASGAANSRHLVRIPDRREAIEHAIQDAAPSDVVLIAGKGHEAYQIVGESRRPFSDVSHAQAALAARASRS